MVSSNHEHPRKAALRRAHALALPRVIGVLQAAQKTQVSLMPPDQLEFAYCTAQLGAGVMTELFFRYVLADMELRGKTAGMEHLEKMRENLVEFEKRLKTVEEREKPKFVLDDEDPRGPEPDEPRLPGPFSGSA